MRYSAQARLGQWRRSADLNWEVYVPLMVACVRAIVKFKCCYAACGHDQVALINVPGGEGMLSPTRFHESHGPTEIVELIEH
jgi:hypothetical protein